MVRLGLKQCSMSRNCFALSSQMTGEFSLFGEGHTRESRLVLALLGAANVMSLPISPALDFSDYNSIRSGNLEEKRASAPGHLP
jgi:hypothetical protein